MSRHPGALHARFAAIVAAAAFGALALAGCGSLVEVSSHITPLPLNCATPRPATAVDSFTTPVTLQSGASGLQYGDISVGCGKVATASATVNVQFTVWLADGTQVITTRGAGQPTNSLQLGNSQTLQFWRLGVPGMRVGGVRKLVVPPALAFGSAGSTSANVPANATLVVDVELISIA
jgi:FKBP-type peptidyl-prolyl cis-trans isomerase FkpA